MSKQLFANEKVVTQYLGALLSASLEFVMKIVKTFPEVELYWLLNGKGSFPKVVNSPLSEKTTSSSAKIDKLTAPNLEDDLFSQTTQVNQIGSTVSSSSSKTNKKISRVIIFYEDGTFDAYEN